MEPHLHRLDIKELAIARRSSMPAPWAITSVRELVREDLILLASPDKASDPKAPLARIGAPHHMLARLVAEGKDPVEVSLITGYTPERVRTLCRDPAFSELVSHYESNVVAARADVQAQITHIALVAGQRLQEKLDNADEMFTKKELKEIWTAGLDRAGHGPTSKSILTVNDPTNVLNKLQSILATESRGRVISRDTVEAEYVEIINVTTETSSGIEACDAGTVGAVAGAEETEGPGGGRDSVSEQSLGGASNLEPLR